MQEIHVRRISKIIAARWQQQGFDYVQRNLRSTDRSNSAFGARDHNNFARCRKIRIIWIKCWVQILVDGLGELERRVVIVDVRIAGLHYNLSSWAMRWNGGPLLWNMDMRFSDIEVGSRFLGRRNSENRSTTHTRILRLSITIAEPQSRENLF